MVAKNQLPKFVRIQTIYLGAHSNATHTLFHNNQYDLVAKVEQTKLNIPADLLASWKANIDLEVEINKQSMMSALTKELEAKDVDRDRVLSRLFGLIKVHRLSFVEAESKPAERLYAALKPYLGIQKEAFGDETIHIVGLRYRTLHGRGNGAGAGWAFDATENAERGVPKTRRTTPLRFCCFEVAQCPQRSPTNGCRFRGDLPMYSGFVHAGGNERRQGADSDAC